MPVTLDSCPDRGSKLMGQRVTQYPVGSAGAPAVLAECEGHPDLTSDHWGHCPPDVGAYHAVTILSPRRFLETLEHEISEGCIAIFTW
jgi:hypothetical protein